MGFVNIRYLKLFLDAMAAVIDKEAVYGYGQNLISILRN